MELEEALSSPANDTELIKKISEELKKAYANEEAYWKQRSRMLCLKLGDRNTGHFHAVTKHMKRENSFSVIEDANGKMVYKEGQISSMIVGYYKKLFTSVGRVGLEIVDEALVPKIFAEENESLITVLNAIEIKDAIFSVHADIDSGPDGFSASFFHTNWETIIADIVTESIHQFFTSGIMQPKVNDTFIRLIPKIQNPQAVSDYRPIALCNVYYKIILKILTKRMQPLLFHVISENQSAFVLGRAISDNVLITHEVIHYLKTSKAKQRVFMVVKTDMSKAYDRLELEFIRRVLLRLGFHVKWVQWIMACINSVTYAFLINGSPRGRVKPSSGICQGDPLSPYIFIMCSEVLSGQCNKAKAEGTLEGVKVAKGSPWVNHLFFADDTMFFLKANKDISAALVTILKQYEMASGQTINANKSVITF